MTINAKLQELCRQLQQQNKAIVEQAKETVGQEQLSRQEFTEKVGETLKSVTSRYARQQLGCVALQRLDQAPASNVPPVCLRHMGPSMRTR